LAGSRRALEPVVTECYSAVLSLVVINQSISFISGSTAHRKKNTHIRQTQLTEAIKTVDRGCLQMIIRNIGRFNKLSYKNVIRSVPFVIYLTLYFMCICVCCMGTCWWCI